MIKPRLEGQGAEVLPDAAEFGTKAAPKAREASVVCVVDFGGKSIRARIVKDGRWAEMASVDTFQKRDEMTVAERVDGLAGRMASAVKFAASKAGIRVGDIQAIGFGAPGAHDPQTNLYRMPNAIGRDPETGQLAAVNFEGALRKALAPESFEGYVAAANDCDVAAAAKERGKVVVVQAGRGPVKTLKDNQKTIYILLGTGIGGGVNTSRGIDEGNSGAMELGHGEVYANIPEGLRRHLRCGCGKGHEGSICVEAVSSTRAQEKMMSWLLKRAYEGGGEFNAPEVGLLLDATLQWNRKKLGKAAAQDAQRFRDSLVAIEALKKSLKRGSENAALVGKVAFDSGVIDSLAKGDKPKAGLAAQVKSIAGEHMGRFIRAVLAPMDPAEVVIGGGGAGAFDAGERGKSPFWDAMMLQIEGVENDPFGSMKNMRIEAVTDETVNLGMQGSYLLAQKKFMEEESKKAEK
jgi:predicted NBD/HSP70 family sugar kinase